MNDDLFWGGTNTTTDSITFNNTTTNKASDLGDLLGDPRDPLAALLGKSAPTIQQQQPRQGNIGGGFAANFGSSQPSFLQPSTTMPQSASFQNLNTNSSGFLGGGNLIDSLGSSTSGSGKIPKNSSSPNLLSDLILGDIISGPVGMDKININSSAGASGGGGSSNPTLSQTGSSRPNYNRTAIFDPPQSQQQDKKQNLNDVFGDILTSQGFASSNRMDGGRTINDMRKVELLSNPNANPTQIKVRK
jgi:hypothetical protein